MMNIILRKYKALRSQMIDASKGFGCLSKISITVIETDTVDDLIANVNCIQYFRAAMTLLLTYERH